MRQASMRPSPSAASACARSADGGSAGTSSTARSNARQGRLVAAALVEIAAEPARGGVPTALQSPVATSSIARRRAPRRAAPRRSGWPARPPTRRARRGRSDELRRVRHGVPQLERVLEMPERLCKAEAALRLARRLDRGGSASALRPAAAQWDASSAARCRSATRELVGDPARAISSRSPGRIVV